MPKSAARTNPGFSELDVVCLRFDTADGDRVLEAGSIGTIVHCYAGGAFEIEFAEPTPAVLTLEALDIAPYADAA